MLGICNTEIFSQKSFSFSAEKNYDIEGEIRLWRANHYINLYYRTWSVTQTNILTAPDNYTTTTSVFFEQYGKQNVIYQSVQYDFHRYLYFCSRC